MSEYITNSLKSNTQYPYDWNSFDENSFSKNNPKNKLLFDFYSEEAKKARQECAEKIKEYQAKGDEAKEKKLGFIKQIKNLLAQMKSVDKNSEDYANLKKECWAIRSAKVSASNDEYGWYMYAYFEASSNAINHPLG